MSSTPALERHPDRLVDDVRPFEQHKLWLNASHSQPAHACSIRVHVTVDEAVAAAAYRAEVESLRADALQPSA